jgi:hypothetical protein
MTKQKIGKNQIQRPSGILQSKDSKYYYWRCVVSGISTFANGPRFKKVVEQFGSEENLFKTFVSRPAKKYLEAGWTPQDIEALADKNKGKLPPLGAQDGKVDVSDVVGEHKAPKAKKVKTNKVGETKPEVKVEEKPVYAWQKEANFFGEGKITPIPVDVAEVTKESCIRPDVYLDSICEGCPHYVQCVLPTKYTQEDWTNNEKRNSRKVKVKKLVFVESPQQES